MPSILTQCNNPPLFFSFPPYIITTPTLPLLSYYTHFQYTFLGVEGVMGVMKARAKKARKQEQQDGAVAVPAPLTSQSKFSRNGVTAVVAPEGLTTGFHTAGNSANGSSSFGEVVSVTSPHQQRPSALSQEDLLKCMTRVHNLLEMAALEKNLALKIQQKNERISSPPPDDETKLPRRKDTGAARKRANPGDDFVFPDFKRFRPLKCVYEGPSSAGTIPSMVDVCVTELFGSGGAALGAANEAPLVCAVAGLVVAVDTVLCYTQNVADGLALLFTKPVSLSTQQAKLAEVCMRKQVIEARIGDLIASKQLEEQSLAKRTHTERVGEAFRKELFATYSKNFFRPVTLGCSSGYFGTTHQQRPDSFKMYEPHCAQSPLMGFLSIVKRSVEGGHFSYVPVSEQTLEVFCPGMTFIDNQVAQAKVARMQCRNETPPYRCNELSCTYLHPNGHVASESRMCLSILQSLEDCMNMKLCPPFPEITAFRTEYEQIFQRSFTSSVNTLEMRGLLEKILRWVNKYGMGGMELSGGAVEQETPLVAIPSENFADILATLQAAPEVEAEGSRAAAQIVTEFVSSTRKITPFAQKDFELRLQGDASEAEALAVLSVYVARLAPLSLEDVLITPASQPTPESVSTIEVFESALQDHPCSLSLYVLYIEGLSRMGKGMFQSMIAVTTAGLSRCVAMQSGEEKGEQFEQNSYCLFGLILMRVFLLNATEGGAAEYLYSMLEGDNAQGVFDVFIAVHAAALPCLLLSLEYGTFPTQMHAVWGLLPGAPFFLKQPQKGRFVPHKRLLPVLDRFLAYEGFGEVRQSLVLARTQLLTVCEESHDALRTVMAEINIAGQLSNANLWLSVLSIVHDYEPLPGLSWEVLCTDLLNESLLLTFKSILASLDMNDEWERATEVHEDHIQDPQFEGTIAVAYVVTLLRQQNPSRATVEKAATVCRTALPTPHRQLCALALSLLQRRHVSFLAGVGELMRLVQNGKAEGWEREIILELAMAGLFGGDVV